MCFQTVVFAVALLAVAVVRAKEPAPHVLVYTRNGLTIEGKRGYIHDNIPSSVAAIRALGAAEGFIVEVTDDPEAFCDENLARFRVLIFSNTNNQIFDTEDQRKALQRYIRGGGGFVGIHSACGSMRDWPWFWAMIGGSFVRHPKLQEFTINVVEPRHPSTEHLARTFRWTDEFYFIRDMPPGLRVLLAGDVRSLNDPAKPVNEISRPLAWCHIFEGGRCWFTTLGHRKETYSDPAFQRHILGGIRWAMDHTNQ